MQNNRLRPTKLKCYTGYTIQSHIQELATSCEISDAQDGESKVAISTYCRFSGFWCEV